MDPDVTDGGYRPPEIADIDTADDREFAVAPGAGGSPDPSN